MKVNIEGARGVAPKPTIDNPIKHNPVIKILFLPIRVMSLPTTGDPRMTATEYIQKMYPIMDTSTPHLSSSNGRKGTTNE